MLTPQEALTDIAHHAVEFTGMCQKAAKEPITDPEDRKLVQEQLADHLKWMQMLSLVILTDSSEEEVAQ